MSYKSVALSVLLITLVGAAVLAQEAKIPVAVDPTEAYVFLDGMAINPGHTTLKTTPGEHTIAVYNYGFQGQVRKVTAREGNNEEQVFKLQPLGAEVSGPHGFIQIEASRTDPHKAAVLLNGVTPEFHVGHVDMFNNHLGWSQQLIVPPGTHQLTVTRNGETDWSGPITVEAGQRVILSLPSGKIRTQAVDNGASATPRRRFDAGTASAAVNVAPVSGNLSVSPKQINCGETAKLAWNSTDAVETKITSDSGDFGNLAPNGVQAVSPRKTTRYHFRTAGPGGIVESSETVVVNTGVQATVSGTPEAHYLRVGDKVLRQDPATLNWSVDNADNVVVNGETANPSGTTTLPVAPEKNANGRIDETKEYTVAASNVCGGSGTTTGVVHLAGLVETMFSSVFFPTAYPTRKDPNKGLLPSQQKQLDRIANIFTEYVKAVPEAKLTLIGSADVRGSTKDNLGLSERRLAVVKAYLVTKGIPADSIATLPKGEEAPLDEPTVAALEAQNPQQPPVGRTGDAKSKWLAYNRRVDIAIEPAALQSGRFYPNQANDLEMLLNPKPLDVRALETLESKTLVASGQ